MLTPEELRERVRAFLAEHDPRQTPAQDWLNARFDAGLAWVHYPEGLGGLGLSRSLQHIVDAEFAAAGAPDNNSGRNAIGLGMAAPTILAYGTEEQQKRWLRELWTGREVWCQLFSEPGAGSDLAALATRAIRDGDSWVVNGQKVWTSQAHLARRALLVARTDPDVPKHAGLTYFAVDMTAPGVEVRPLRQITGEAEFNEVFLTDVRIPDEDRIGPVGEGWKVATATLMSERVSIGSARAAPREAGHDRPVRRHLARAPRVAHPGAARPAAAPVDRGRGGQAGGGADAPAAGRGPARARGLGRQAGLRPAEPGDIRAGRRAQRRRGLRYDDWSMRRPEHATFFGRGPGYRYLRANGNSIEGGTSEILRNIIAERVLGLPPEPRRRQGRPMEGPAR